MSEKIQTKDRGIIFGTSRCRKLLDRLCSCDDKLKFIHIAGTNGKGSLAEYFTQILLASGEKVGTFSSPEVYDYYDQFRINGKILDSEKFDSYLERVKSENIEVGATAFEVETAAAIYAFFRENCTWCVLECGMGGREDSTNAIHHKELAVISSISLEHTDFLGETIEEICYHKSGIIQGKCVLNPLQSGQVIDYFKSNNPDITIADSPSILNRHTFSYKGETYEIKASGEEQLYNAATAVEGAKMLGIDSRVIKEGLSKAKLRGRREEFKRDRLYVLDGGHNGESLRYLADYILENKMSTELIYGSLKDKDLDANFRELSRAVGAISLVECPSYRAMPLEKMQSKAKEYFGEVKTFESIDQALKSTKDRVIVSGSFTLLKEALRWIEKRQ